ncbi:Lrp/AsnC family transcriptional regulator [Candidatus Woesearchaeota archaeon]|nr:Lrp/AsnC family transcriptional regulator [Candidatus Woesearchaeota archaeon]
MPVKQKLSSRTVDEKDKKILMVLQENGREQLNKIAKKVGLSIDSTHRRIKVMLEKGVFHSTILINPRIMGYPLIADIKIKLKNVSEEKRQQFINYMKGYDRCTELLATMGDYDFTCVLIAKDSNELEKISTQIRQMFKELILEWKGILILTTYKFEHYDLT